MCGVQDESAPTRRPADEPPRPLASALCQRDARIFARPPSSTPSPVRCASATRAPSPVLLPARPLHGGRCVLPLPRALLPPRACAHFHGRLSVVCAECRRSSYPPPRRRFSSTPCHCVVPARRAHLRPPSFQHTLSIVLCQRDACTFVRPPASAPSPRWALCAAAPSCLAPASSLCASSRSTECCVCGVQEELLPADGPPRPLVSALCQRDARTFARPPASAPSPRWALCAAAPSCLAPAPCLCTSSRSTECFVCGVHLSLSNPSPPPPTHTQVSKLCDPCP